MSDNGANAGTHAGTSARTNADTSSGHAARRPGTLRIGLVGPIACGKSTVAGWLGDVGAIVIDADRFARSVLDPGTPALAAVFATFGDELRLSDGSLDRAALAARVFSDAEALARLEAIVHPAVSPPILEALEEADGLVVLEAIRLVDGGYAALMDEVWLVTCAPAIQQARLASREIEGAAAVRRIEAQSELVERAAAVATRVIDTSGTRQETHAAVLAALEAARVAVARADAASDHGDGAPGIRGDR